MNKTPIYPHNAVYAREHGEIEQYCISHFGNLACKDDIQRTISRSFDGMHLQKNAPTEVLDKYGSERVQLVLAATVRTKAWDGRFSESNKAWANTVELPNMTNSNGESRLYEYAVDSHPAVVDGFIGLARKEMKEREKTSVKDMLKESSGPTPQKNVTKSPER